MNTNHEAEKMDNALEALFEFVREANNGAVKIINPEKYRDLLKAAADLTDLLRETTPQGEVNIKINDTFNLGAVSVELDELTIFDPGKFAKVIQKASNFEIYPLTNGKILLDISFHSVLKTIGKEL